MLYYQRTALTPPVQSAHVLGYSLTRIDEFEIEVAQFGCLGCHGEDHGHGSMDAPEKPEEGSSVLGRAKWPEKVRITDKRSVEGGYYNRHSWGTVTPPVKST